jgi:micrococcal nuclease
LGIAGLPKSQRRTELPEVSFPKQAFGFLFFPYSNSFTGNRGAGGKGGVMLANKNFNTHLRFSWPLALLFSVFSVFALLSPADSGQRSYEQRADVVLRVVDGDTLTINHNGRKESIRLIGIDTPESKPNKKAKKDATRNSEDLATIVELGKEAAKFVRTLVHPGDPISIEFDKQIRDKYGRLLGYIYLADGTMLNEEIVRAGYASLMTYPPNVRYQDRFLRAYHDARENNRGLWGKY